MQVLLPAVDGEAARPGDDDDAAVVGSGSETVLLVEDDLDVRRRAGTLLERSGYHVLAAGNGARHVILAGEHAGRIDLLLSEW